MNRLRKFVSHLPPDVAVPGAVLAVIALAAALDLYGWL
jgi:hypothetical protein